MAKKTINTNGKGRVVSPAPKSANGKSATAKSAGIKVRKPTEAQVHRAYDVAIASAKWKKPYRPCPEFLTAILRAWAIPTLSQKGITTSQGQASKRREFCESVGAGFITVDLVVHSKHLEATNGIGVFTDRSENTIRESLKSFCRVMGYPEDFLFSVRSEKWESGSVSGAYIVRR